MKKLTAIILSLTAVCSAMAQEFPGEIFEPYGVPTIEGARVLNTKINNDTKIYSVAYDTTFEQVMQWIDDLESKGMIIGNKDKRELNEDRNREYHSSEMDIHFPIGTYGNQQEVYLFLEYNFVYPIEFLFSRSIGAQAAIAIIPIYGEGSTKPVLETPQADILSAFGMADVSGFIPEHTLQFIAKTVKSDKVFRSDLPAGTPIIGTLEARFTHGYVPAFADVDRWANDIYRACASNATEIDPIGSSSEITTTHWWNYTYQGVTYQVYVSAELDHLGRFELSITRL